jgi:hypothetical protein
LAFCPTLDLLCTDGEQGQGAFATQAEQGLGIFRAADSFLGKRDAAANQQGPPGVAGRAVGCGVKRDRVLARYGP